MSTHQEKAGFTLLELLIVLSIIAILLSLTYPAFQEAVRTSRRSDAMAALLKLQLAQEKLRTRCAFYAQNVANRSACGPDASSTDVNGSATGSDGYYIISIKAKTASGGTYVALAAPVGAQSDDHCGVFAINQDGPVYTDGGTDYADAGCWSR